MKPPGDRDVIRRGLWVAARVIVYANEGGGVGEDETLEISRR